MAAAGMTVWLPRACFRRPRRRTSPGCCCAPFTSVIRWVWCTGAAMNVRRRRGSRDGLGGAPVPLAGVVHRCGD